MVDVTKVDFASDEMQAGVEAIKRNLASYIEMTETLAKIRRASYNAHIKEGFTPEEALVLCQSLLL